MSTDDRHDRDDQDEEPPGTTLSDPDDYHRRQRLKEIHKARQRVANTISSFDRTTRKKEGRQQRRELAFAVALYVSELEPIIDDTDADNELTGGLPWATLSDFADDLGRFPDDYDSTVDGFELYYLPKSSATQIFRMCNRILADVKPLIEEEENTEWEV